MINTSAPVLTNSFYEIQAIQAQMDIERDKRDARIKKQEESEGGGG